MKREKMTSFFSGSPGRTNFSETKWSQEPGPCNGASKSKNRKIKTNDLKPDDEENDEVYHLLSAWPQDRSRKAHPSLPPSSCAQTLRAFCKLQGCDSTDTPSRNMHICHYSVCGEGGEAEVGVS